MYTLIETMSRMVSLISRILRFKASKKNLQHEHLATLIGTLAWSASLEFKENTLTRQLHMNTSLVRKSRRPWAHRTFM